MTVQHRGMDITFMQLEGWVLAVALLSTASQETGKYAGRGRFGKMVSRASQPAINVVAMAAMSPQDGVDLEVQ